jgi:hypothetical protein
MHLENRLKREKTLFPFPFLPLSLWPSQACGPASHGFPPARGPPSPCPGPAPRRAAQPPPPPLPGGPARAHLRLARRPCSLLPPTSPSASLSPLHDALAARNRRPLRPRPRGEFHAFPSPSSSSPPLFFPSPGPCLPRPWCDRPWRVAPCPVRGPGVVPCPYAVRGPTWPLPRRGVAPARCAARCGLLPRRGAAPARAACPTPLLGAAWPWRGAGLSPECSARSAMARLPPPCARGVPAPARSGRPPAWPPAACAALACARSRLPAARPLPSSAAVAPVLARPPSAWSRRARPDLAQHGPGTARPRLARPWCPSVARPPARGLAPARGLLARRGA